MLFCTIGVMRNGIKPLSGALETYCLLDPWEQISVKFRWDAAIFFFENSLKYAVCKIVAILFRPRRVKNDTSYTELFGLIRLQ